MDDAIINSLAEYCKDNSSTEWPKYVSTSHLDRMTVRQATGYPAFELLYGRDSLFRVELAVPL